ncbi:MAG: C4-dicarboxylate transporter [Comamonadaceae bacterium]|nr:C4-dicarboxylate transporter [Comamonadaceae bacterium]
MKIVTFLLRHRRLTWMALAGLSVALGLAVGLASHRYNQAQRVSLLQTDAQRSAIALMSQTLNGNLMGSIKLLGLIDDNIKLEASNQPLSSPTVNLPVLATLGVTFGAEGVFIVGGDGIVKTSWDRDNKPSTGWDVRFRPYFQTAIQGKTTVYAAVSMARGERALYFASPIHAQDKNDSPVIGVLVARTTLGAVDVMLKSHADGALLLSPQGVVFASSGSDWMGMIEGVPDAQRLQKVRDLKQFGAMFEKTVPLVLPLTSAAGLQQVKQQRMAVASAKVDWNDPSGEWTLVLLEDVARSVAWTQAAKWGSLVVMAMLLLGWLALRLLQTQQAQAQSTLQLQTFAKKQEANIAFRNQLAELSAKLQRCRQLPELAQTFLQAAREQLGAVQGVIYLADTPEAQVLQLVGSSACATPAPAQLALGDTLLGQCALERRLKIIATPGQGYWTLRSGLGQTQPAALILAPMLVQDTLIGVQELAVLEAPDALALEKLSQALALLSSAVESLTHNLRSQQNVLTPSVEGTA